VEGQFRAQGNSYQPVPANMACESGNFTIADLDRKAGYGPLNGLCTDLVKLNSIGERRGKTPAALDYR
jgi:hypothetical protein